MDKLFKLATCNFFTLMTIKDIKAPSILHTAGNGIEALEFLRNEKNKKPGIILLDLNMPKMNGIEFLKIVKQNGALRTIPVVVLTTSKGEEERVESYRLGVVGYMIKPVDYGQFVEVMRTIDRYWRQCELPE